MRARWRAAAIVASAGIVVSVGFAAPASAHNVLVDSTPEAGEVLTTLPSVFSITTNENLLELQGSNGFALQVRDAAGTYYGDGCVTVVNATMSATAAVGASGNYTMLWQVVSEDGHSVDGEIPFTWQPESAGDPVAGSATPPVCGEAATPEPSAGASQPPATPDLIAEAPTASGIDLPTVLWIGGAVLAAGIAIAVAIALASRKKSP